MKTQAKVLGIVIIALLSASCKTTKDNKVQDEASVAKTEKAAGDDLKEKRWSLIEIGGKPVKNDQTANAPYLILSADGRVTGSGGCNSFRGDYEQPGLLRIKFSNVVTTLKACLDMSVETELMKALRTADSYSLSADGKFLSLNRARMAPLARFEAK